LYLGLRLALVYLLAMKQRHYTLLDRALISADNALRTVLARTPAAGRTSPGEAEPEANLSETERRHAAGLMRVNHAGEVAAQALYQGQSLGARDNTVAEKMAQAAREEQDHLAWCQQRLDELGSQPSALTPFWYVGSFAIGAIAGAVGDKWSLGFVVETEKQVVDHLDDHLRTLPSTDRKSRRVVEQMKEDELAHATAALRAGAAELPGPARLLMRITSKVMTKTAYRL
jgi:ubiquinone biosynthesis monooxygenase Coq7